MTDPFQSLREQMDQPRGDTVHKEAGADASALSLAPMMLPEDGQKADRVETGLIEASKNVRLPLSGGTFAEDYALTLMNANFFVGDDGQETGVFRIEDDGSAAFLAPEQFKLKVQNIFVRVGNASKPIPAEKFWKEHPKRHERTIVFKPSGVVGPSEFNLWRGYGVEPRRGRRRQWSLHRHIREVICRRDRNKFGYLMRFLAWSVQNPDKHAGVVIMLKSRKQGTGKSTLGKVMLDIFGPHGARIDDKERLLGRFTDWLDTIGFVLAEEILWANDHKSADKFKSMVTGDTIQVERKFGSCRQIPNRLKIIATSNHEHAVAAGVEDRRNVVFDVSDERAGDRAWFDRLYHDLENGGTAEFLDFLLNMRLGSWHPRQILKTTETLEQQRMSGDSVSQWAQACIDADAVVGLGPYDVHELGAVLSAQTLREAYNGFCRQQGQRAQGTEMFGKACADMFGPRQRLRALQTGTGGRRRPWGYHVPKGKKWQEKVDERLGIKQ